MSAGCSRGLSEAGYEVPSIWAWTFKRPEHYLGAGPVLVEHLREAHDERLILGLAKLLSHKEFGFAAPALIAELGEVEKSGTRSALASALVATGVGGHEAELLRFLEQNRSASLEVVLLEALKKAGADLSPHKRRALLRERDSAYPFIAGGMVLAGLAVLALVMVAAARTRLPSGLMAVLIVYGALYLLLGAELWRRSSGALPVYIAWVLAGCAAQTGYQVAADWIPWPAFFAMQAGGLIVFVVFGRYLFGEPRV